MGTSGLLSFSRLPGGSPVLLGVGPRLHLRHRIPTGSRDSRHLRQGQGHRGNPGAPWRRNVGRFQQTVKLGKSEVKYGKVTSTNHEIHSEIFGDIKMKVYGPRLPCTLLLCLAQCSTRIGLTFLPFFVALRCPQSVQAGPPGMMQATSAIDFSSKLEETRGW